MWEIPIQLAIEQSTALAVRVSGGDGFRAHTPLRHQGIVLDRAPLLEERRDAKLLAIADDAAHPLGTHLPSPVAALAASYQPIRLHVHCPVKPDRPYRRFIGNKPDDRGDAAEHRPAPIKVSLILCR